MCVTNARVLSSDTFYSLYSGRFIAAHGLPRVDTLTVAGNGRPWLDQQWLAHLAFYELWRVGGYPLIGLVSALLIGLAFGGFAYFLLTIGTSPVRTTLWSIIAFFVCQPNTATRAQSFAYPLFVLALAAILYDSRRASPKRFAALVVPALIVWANVHGSIVLAAPLIAGYCLTRVVELFRANAHGEAARYLAIALAAAISPLATPYGPRIFDYYGSVFGNGVLKQASAEWHMTTLSPANLQFILLGVLLLALGGLALRRGFRPNPVLVALTFVTAAAAIDSVRNQSWFAFPAVVFVTNALNWSPATDGPVAVAVPTAPSTSRVPRLLAMTCASALCTTGFIALAFAGASTERLQVLLLFVGILAALIVLTSPARGPVAARLKLAACVVVVLASLGGVGALATTSTTQFDRFTPRTAIAHATPYIDSHPHVRVLGDDFAAGPLLWQIPTLAGRVGFDPRYEIYRPTVLKRYVGFVTGTRGWQATLHGYDVVVVSVFQNPDLAARMAKLHGWHRLFQDSQGAVFVRS